MKKFFYVAVTHQKLHETHWHAHDEYQLFILKSGLITFQFKNQHIIVPAGQAGWIPSKMMHKAKMIGRVSAVLLYLDPSLCKELPDHVFTFTPTPLMQEIVVRLETFAKQKKWPTPYKNLLQVLIGEIKTANVVPLSLPMPTEANLTFVAKRFIRDLSIDESIEYWAEEAHMSKRTFTRHFRLQTGMSFAKWCQQARVMRSLEYLNKGKSVTWIALTLGYNSVSAFIKVFRQWLGNTPSQYKPGP